MLFEFLHPSLILPVFLSPVPPLHSPSLPPSVSLHLFPLFFLLWTAYCSILKVPACVLSCPLLPSMHRSDLELCRLRMGTHFWCQERGVGEDRQTLWCCFILLSVVSLSARCCHRFERGFFSPTLPFLLLFFSFWPWNCVHEAEK